MTIGGYYEFEVSLAYIKPRIWRRFLISADATFADLHDAIQDAFGWFGEHLWVFKEPGRSGNTIAGIPDDEFDDDDKPDAWKVALSAFFDGRRGANRCQYLYDFGDGWYHQVVLKGKVPETGGFTRKLLAGRRACPLEDCGGVPGYERMVAFVETGKDPYGGDVEELTEWTDDWHPDEFNLNEFKEAFDR